MPSVRQLALTSLLGLTGGGVSAFQVSTLSCRSFGKHLVIRDVLFSLFYCFGEITLMSSYQFECWNIFTLMSMLNIAPHHFFTVTPIFQFILSGSTSNKFFPNNNNRRSPWQVRANSNISNFDSIRPYSSAVVSSMADSVAEKDSTQQQQQPIQSQQQLQNNSQPSPLANNKGSEEEGSAKGEVISFLIGHMDGSGNSAGFAVVRVSEEDVAATSPISAAAAVTNAAAATTEGEKKVNGEKEEDKVELASALFGKPVLKPMENAAGKKNNNGGVIGE